MQNNPPKIVIIAGEPSGDFIGAHLMTSLRDFAPEAQFYGVGGTQMMAAGLSSFLSVDQLSIMGITEALTKVFSVYQKLKFVTEKMRDLQPDVIITIDFPGFNFRLAKMLQGSGVPLIHYVAPTVWAWRPKRAEKISKLYDHLLTLFPFEAPYFEKEGLKTTFVGHPLVEMPYGQGVGQRFREMRHIAPDTSLLCVLPGSRVGEVQKLLPIFKEVVQNIQRKKPAIEIVIPTVPQAADFVKEQMDGWGIKSHVVLSLEEKADAYASCMGAIASSGTISLELAMAGLPHLIVYKVSWLSAFILRAQIKVPYVCMVNILLDQLVVPELLQEKCTADDITAAAEVLFDSDVAMDVQRRAFQNTRKMLTPEKSTPSVIAAQVVGACLSSAKYVQK